MRCLRIESALVFAVLLGAAGADEPAANEDQLEALSLLESHYANLDSIDSVDVSITTTRSRFSVEKGIWEDVEVRQRLVLDEKNQVGVLATLQKFVGTRERESSEDSRSRVVIAVRDGGRAATRQFPEAAIWVSLAERTFGSVAHYPDFRFLGHYPFPISAGAISPAQVQAALKVSRTAHSGMTYSLLPQRKAAIVFRDENHPPDIRLGKRVFDLESNQLESVRASGWVRSEKKMMPKLVEQFQWKLANDISVPVVVTGEQRKSGIGPDRKRIVWNEQYDISLRWFAVNSELKMEQSPTDFLDDMNKVLQFIEAKGMKEITRELE
ncbi:hypothetical protein K239x_56930 [Planctomycetes bacterium K23_9]|uniref:Uncharacterized protein n=2 Tax=Stieleria marina TaxID=1930275 RepID=A0A517P2T2_9BACT|nr:hypothetical protein K239x_56930 [Planctomycetes bacterium K23_9]